MTNFNQGTALSQILLVEDDSNTSSVFTHALRAKGYQVTQACTAAEACEMLRHNKVALVLTDWVLPDGTAAIVCETARQEHPHTPIVLVSGQADMNALHIANCEVDVWLSKPVDASNLLSTVEQLLSLHPVTES